ncbi:DmpA family aminopeptidase [Kiloniella majae]|uniref:DmpA family aminopeptidase n=1 Tax=Kiloniella majae TaxID=1938558 RepID=UPI00210035DA|nr:P1 family peptidase [Kiloniella majae]
MKTGFRQYYWARTLDALLKNRKPAMSDISFNSKKTTPARKMRAAGLGLEFPGEPGQHNSITDVAGVSVGYTTLIEGQGALQVGKGPVRTGVTAILPRSKSEICIPVFAGCFSFNGNGELTSSHYLEEVGLLTLPITITNTHACGLARDATLRWASQIYPVEFLDSFGLPVAAETYDGFLNDINGFHVTNEHVYDAIETAKSGPIEEGSVGGGTGMKSFGFKAGSGTASRRVGYAGRDYTVGVFVQSNFGKRDDLTILGHPIGKGLSEPKMVEQTASTELSSIIGIVATDAPLLPHQLKRLARRAALGMGKTGGIGAHGSGDIFLAFSTANGDVLAETKPAVQSVAFIPDADLDFLFEAVIQATEEAIINSMVANEDMEGRDGNFVPALPHSVLKDLA